MTQTASSESRFSVREYLQMVETGTLGPEDRVELLEGVIVSMSPQNPLHASCTKHAYDLLRDVIGERAVVRSQLPLVLGNYSVPEPDVAVVSGRENDYYAVHPQTAVLVIEVADASLVQDRLTKTALYAAAGIPEYWIVNLRDMRVEVRRDPQRETASYSSSSVVGRGDRLNVTMLAGISIDVDLLLPPD